MSTTPDTPTAKQHARVFHRDQLAAWDLPGAWADDAPEILHREQVDTRRWVSVNELIFRAPDDGKAYRVTYEQGLTEVQEDHDEWDYRDHVVGEEVEEYDRTVKAWRPVGTAPATAQPTHEQRLAALDGRDPLAFVLIRPAAESDTLDVESQSRGMSPAAVAHVLSVLTDRYDHAARAEDDEEQQQRPAVDVVPAHVLTAFEQDATARQAHAAALDTTGDPDEDVTLVPYHGEHGYPEGEAPEEQPAAPRILTGREYEAAYRAARYALGAHASRIGRVAIDDAVTAALATAGILTPPPEPEPDMCPAMFADREGDWRQCAEDPGHNPADGHSDGEWSWPDGQTHATPDEDAPEAQR